MKDRNGKVVREGELITLIGRPDLNSADYWIVFDCVEYGIFTDFIIKNCITNEVKLVSQDNIQRSY